VSSTASLSLTLLSSPPHTLSCPLPPSWGSATFTPKLQFCLVEKKTYGTWTFLSLSSAFLSLWCSAVRFIEASTLILHPRVFPQDSAHSQLCSTAMVEAAVSPPSSSSAILHSYPRKYSAEPRSPLHCFWLSALTLISRLGRFFNDVHPFCAGLQQDLNLLLQILQDLPGPGIPRFSRS
jgi:hypothetical protein